MEDLSSHCVICGKLITQAFHVCADCEREWGLEGSWEEHPAWVRYLLSADVRERRHLERRRDSGEEEEPETFDLQAYGGANTDQLPDEEDEAWLFWDRGPSPVDPEQSENIRCVACGTVFKDDCLTWPVYPTKWMEPVCPECGITHYEDPENEFAVFGCEKALNCPVVNREGGCDKVTGLFAQEKSVYSLDMDERDALSRGRKRLNLEQQIIYHLIIGGFTQREIAEDRGITQQAISKKLSVIKRIIKEEVERGGNNG